jgi:LPXTG-site transpeptidase (sortase) family protein
VLNLIFNYVLLWRYALNTNLTNSQKINIFNKIIYIHKKLLVKTKKAFPRVLALLSVAALLATMVATLPMPSPVMAQTIISYPATMNKSFSPIAIVPGQVSRLKVTVFNPNLFALTLGTPGWTDTLPAGVKFSNPLNFTTNCTGGTLSATGNVLSISGGSVPAKVGIDNGECSVEVDVTSTVPGNHINTIGAGNLVSTDPSGQIPVTNSTPASATLTVGIVQAPSLSKAFNPPTMSVGATSRLTITLKNNDLTTALTETTYTDTLPAGLVLAAAVTPTLTGCGGATLTAVSGTDIITLNNATVGANSSCTVAVNVYSTTQGYYTNTIPAGPTPGSISTRQDVTNVNAASAPLNVQNVGITKAFLPASIVAGATSTLTITLQNPTGTAYTGAGITDTLPAGLIIAGPGSTNCGGGIVTAVVGGQTVQLTGGTIPASATPPSPLGTCTITVPVTTLPNAPLNTDGIPVNSLAFTNTIPANALLTTQGISNPSAVSANLAVTRWLTGTKSFSPASIPAGGTSMVTITLRNNRTDADLSGVNFTDTLPTGLTVVPTPATPQCGGTITSATDSVTLTGGAILRNTSCTITFQVKASTVATYSNTIPAGDITTGQGASNILITSNNLGVVTGGGPVIISKAFASNPIAPGTNVQLTITLRSPTDIGVTGLAFSDTLPTGMKITNSPAAYNGCGGTLTATTGTGVITLANGVIANPNSTCGIRVYVTADESGSYPNSIPIGAVTTTQHRSNTVAANATLVVSSFTMSKKFYPTLVNPNGLSTLTIYLENNSLAAITNVTLTDSLPGSTSNGVIIAPTPNASTTCGAGIVTAVAGSQAIQMTGGTIVPRVGTVNGLCTILVDVQGKGNPTTYTNNILAANVSGYIGNFKITPRAPATAPLSIGNITIRVAKAFDPLIVAGGADSTLSVELINENSVALSGITFTDNMPMGMIVATPANPNVGTCGGTLTAISGASSFSFSGGALAASSSCTVTLRATMLLVGNLTNTIPIGAVTTFNGVSNPQATAATLSNLPGARVTKLFADDSIYEGGTSLLTITIKNPNGIPLTGLGLIDNLPGTLPAGLYIASSPAPVNNCGGTLSAVSPTQLIQLTGGWIAAESTCTLIIPVTSTVQGIYTNTIVAGGLDNTEGISNGLPATDDIIVLGIPELSLVKTASPQTYDAVGQTITYTFVATNTGGVSLSNVNITDPLVGLSALTCLPAAGSTLAPTASMSCTGTRAITQDDLNNGSVLNTATVTGTPLVGPNVSASADEKVTGSQSPSIVVTKTVNPTSVPETGGDVTFTFVVHNSGNVSLTITSLTDDKFGTLTGDADCKVGTVLAVNASCTFDFVTILSGKPSVKHTNTFTAHAVDLLQKDVSSTDNAVVSFTALPPIKALPSTGFAPYKITPLGLKSESYSSTDLTLRIPAIDLKTIITGVPNRDGTFDIDWLWNDVGWLEGTAFPGTIGNSALTGHVYMADGLPGPFVNLKTLRYGQEIIIEQDSHVYTYEVRSVKRVKPADLSSIAHKDYGYLTLITCQGYDQKTESYLYRTVVQAVLVSVK